MGILLNPTWWTDGVVSPAAAWKANTTGGATLPPFAWQTLQGDQRYYFNSLDLNTVLILHMDGGNGSTTFVDSSLLNNTVTSVNGAQQSNTEAIFSSPSAFVSQLVSGNFEYLAIPYLPGGALDLTANNTDWTVELWYYYPSSWAPAATHLLDFTNASQGLFEVFVNVTTNTVEASRSGGGNFPTVTTSGVLNINAWNHIAVVKSGGFVQIYLNGTNAAGPSAIGGPLTPITGTPNLYVGYGPQFSAGGSRVEGYIDEVRISRVARYTANFTPPTAPFTPSIPGGIAALPPISYIGNDIYNITADTLTEAFNLQYSTAIPTPVALSNGLPVVLEATTLPGGFAANTVYYMVNVNTTAASFQLAATVGGSAITITTAGAGVTVRVPPSNAGWSNTGELFGTARLAYQIIAPPLDGSTLQLWYRTGTGKQSLLNGPGATTTVNLTSTLGATGAVSVTLGNATNLIWGITASNGVGAAAVVAVGEGLTDSTYGNVIYNGTAPESENYPTLAALRTRLLIRCGFASQAGNPPPGVANLFNDFLYDAQTRIYIRYPAIPTRHFFKWEMFQGQRMYGLKDNTDDIYKAYTMMFRKGVQWAGIRDDRGTWTPIIAGMDPSLYTMVTQYGRPVRYEVRDVIEVFPAPDTHYELWLIGQRSLDSFVLDTDITTIDGDLVFLTALGIAKTHYGQPDAQSCVQSADLRLGELVAATHMSKRYIPGAVPILPVVRPQLLTFLGNNGGA